MGMDARSMSQLGCTSPALPEPPVLVLGCSSVVTPQDPTLLLCSRAVCMAVGATHLAWGAQHRTAQHRVVAVPMP